MKFIKKHEFVTGQVLKTQKGEKTLLTYIGESDKSRKNKRYIVVKCKCGKIWDVQMSNVNGGGTKCCGKSDCRVRALKKKRDSEVGYKALLYVYKKHARERNLEFNLTYEEFKGLLQQNCHYCGMAPNQIYQLKIPKTDIIRSGVPIVYNGIDRIDSSQNYTLENTVTACKRCNVAKMNQSYDSFLKQIINIYNNLNLKEYGNTISSC